MQIWIVTGISGSGRLELLNEIAGEVSKRGVKVKVHDVGAMMRNECERQRMPMVDERILDLDQRHLRLLRTVALKDVALRILAQPEVELHFVGVHATFRWKGRLIPGVSYFELRALSPCAIVNVVDSVKDIY